MYFQVNNVTGDIRIEGGVDLKLVISRDMFDTAFCSDYFEWIDEPTFFEIRAANVTLRYRVDEVTTQLVTCTLVEKEDK